MKHTWGRKAFTLLEILIVLVILGVISGLAIPSYEASVEKARSQEALQHLAATRDAMVRYFALNNSYVGAAIPQVGTGGTLDYNPNIQEGGQTYNFAYDFSAGPAANSYTLRATRVAGGCGPAPVGTISVNQAGAINKTGVYAQ